MEEVLKKFENMKRKEEEQDIKKLIKFYMQIYLVQLHKLKYIIEIFENVTSKEEFDHEFKKIQFIKFF